MRSGGVLLRFPDLLPDFGKRVVILRHFFRHGAA